MGKVEDEQRRILRYWTLLELFSPQPVKKPTRRSTGPADEPVVEWQPGDPPPWTSLKPPKQRGKQPRVWQHTVYLGVYDLESSYEQLQKSFGEDRDAYDARRAGLSACAAVVLDEKGVLSVGSSILSSAPWAHAHLSAGAPSTSPHWAADFPEAARRFIEEIDELEGSRRDAYGAEEPLPHDEESLRTLLRTAHRAAGITEISELASSRIIIASTARTDNGAEPTSSDFLNSFFLEDLAAVQKDIRRLAPPTALARYLTPRSELRTDHRFDVMTEHAAVDSGAGIARLPHGRWPSKPEHSLALRQQFAVNSALRDLASTGGLMGVNGPPGTGKTTMLRDILAGNVVERARRLARLEHTGDAFTSTVYSWGSGRETRKIRQLRPELTGFEMVVASANNGAVENVTSEIPARSAIAEPWRSGADYFSEIATATLRASSPGDAERSDAWGLIAARLGNKSNRGSFFSHFWFDRKPTSSRGVGSGAAPGMLTRLKQWEDGTVPHRSWSEARAEFRALAHRVEELVGERKAAQERLKRLDPARQYAAERARRRLQLDAELTAARHALQEHGTLLERAETELADATSAWERHLATRPGWLEVLFTLGATIREWRAALAPLEERRDLAESAARQARAHAQQLAEQERTLDADVDVAAADLFRAEADLRALQGELAGDAARFDSGYPGPAWTEEKRELTAPWLGPELDAARSELFLAALRLHEDFLANAGADMRRSVGAAVDVVGGKAPRHLEPEKLLAAWQTFFFVVPMVSTTFASFARMFAGLGRESLGWLFIDEAGQASPQYAAGAIWRSKQVIAVGDPLQLQPVVTMPHKAQRDIAQAFDVGDEWIPPKASVQTLADRVSPAGTTLRTGEEDVWVSAPLTVHRRCDEPMFSLCNSIAYNDIMVSGVERSLDDPEKPDLFDAPDGARVASSRWFDEPARTEGTHLQKNQIDRLRREIDVLRAEGVDPKEIFAISPFRAVADELRRLRQEIPDLRAGTIHTVQGGEAEAVFLVLGGDPASPGAKAWASETVNLVNVAASRAKRRLYVIGDRTQWSRYPYFEELSAALGGPDAPPG